MKAVRVLACALIAFGLLAGVAETQAGAQDVPPAVSRAGRFMGGVYLGLQAGTVDDEGFALGGNVDYYFNNELSIGPLLQMGFTSDLFQLGLSAQVKYTFDVRQLPALKPHVEAGLGFIYASLEDGRDEDDVSFLIPLGFGLEYRLTRQLSLDTTFLLNFTDLDAGKNDNFFLTWLVGVKVPF
jgi:hypothetical protein